MKQHICSACSTEHDSHHQHAHSQRVAVVRNNRLVAVVVDTAVAGIEADTAAAVAVVGHIHPDTPNTN